MMTGAPLVALVVLAILVGLYWGLKYPVPPPPLKPMRTVPPEAPKNYVDRMGEWARQHPDLVYGWAAMTWEGPPDLRDHETSMHMTPLVPAWRVMELEDLVAGLLTPQEKP